MVSHLMYTGMLTWHSSCLSGRNQISPSLKINTPTNDNNNNNKVHCGDAFEHSSISTLWSPQMSTLMPGLECIPVKFRSVFLMALMPLYPRRNKIDAERQFCIYLGTTTSGGQHRTDVFAASAHRLLATCDESVMSWYMRLNLAATRGSIIQCGAVSGGVILGTALLNVRFEDAPDLDCHQTIRCYLYLNAINEATLQVRPTTARVINK